MPAALPLPQGHHSRLDCLEPEPGRPGPHGEARGPSCVLLQPHFTASTLLHAWASWQGCLWAVLHAGNFAFGQSTLSYSPHSLACPPARLPHPQVGGDAQFVRPCPTCPTGVSTPAFNLRGYSPSAFTAPQAAPYAVAASGTADGGSAIWAQVRSWAEDLWCWACCCHVKSAPAVWSAILPAGLDVTQARLSDALPCIAAALQFSLPWPGGTAIKINYGGARAGLLLRLCCHCTVAQLRCNFCSQPLYLCSAASHRHPRCIATLPLLASATLSLLALPTLPLPALPTLLLQAASMWAPTRRHQTA